MTNFGKLVVSGVVACIALAGVGVYYLANKTPNPVAVACTAEAKICPDGKAVGRTGPNCEFAPCPVDTVATTSLESVVYPLYSGSSWQDPIAATTTVGTTTRAGYTITSLPSATTSDIAGIAMPFVNYYDKKLRAAGWSEDTQLAADGAGSSQRVYKKGLGVVMISYTSDFADVSEDVPAQCPCTVSLSIFTTQASQ